MSEIVNAEQYFLAIDQLEELNKYLLEPIGRNTAIALELVLVTPSDQRWIRICKSTKDNLVTFGIKPTFAETGFGYIQAKLECLMF